MVVLTEYIPQQEQAVFTSKPLAEVKETSNLGRVELPEQKIIRKVRLALKVSKTLVVLAVQQPKHPLVSPHLPPEMVKSHNPMPPSEVSLLSPNLSRALAAAFEALEDLKREGLITRYDQEPFEEEGIYHLTAYAKDPNKVDRELGRLSARLSLEFDLPLYVLVSREPDA
ncbi:hypothetical protein [Thermus brockianus]|jgi:hypothetical protein